MIRGQKVEISGRINSGICSKYFSGNKISGVISKVLDNNNFQIRVDSKYFVVRKIGGVYSDLNLWRVHYRSHFLLNNCSISFS